MLTIDPQAVKTGDLHAHMLGAIAPRPIAFASTINNKGEDNLSPFSFFNAFGSNPPTLIFSPARRVRDNTIKHTLENIYENKEVVINVVDYKMVQQMSLSSCEYPQGVDEFIKAGFDKLPSQKIKPKRVAQSPVQMECVVEDVIETGDKGGAGNLIICRIVLMHIDENILGDDGRIDPHKIDLVGRMGGDWYARASGAAIFKVAKPNLKLGIGIDQLPEQIRHSNILTGNDLGMLANVEVIPNLEEVSKQIDEKILSLKGTDSAHNHQQAHQFLEAGNIAEAWYFLL